MENNLFDFETDLKLDIEQVDREHIRLVSMLNQVYSLLSAEEHTQARLFLSQTLAQYVHEHFANEEKFMEQIGFPELEEHKGIHTNFAKSFYDLLPLIQSADETAFRKVLNDTFTWILTHIGGTDRKFATFYHSKGNPSIPEVKQP